MAKRNKKEIKKKKLSKIIKILVPIFIVFIVLLYFFFNYDISFNFGGSREFKRLFELTSFDFYGQSKLMITDDGEYELSSNGDDLEKKTLVESSYIRDKYYKLLKINDMIDEKVKVSYRWYQYDGEEYVRYNNYFNTIYRLYNFSDNLNSKFSEWNPNLKVFSNYNPTLIYNNVPIYEGASGHEEVYRIKIKNDKYYKDVLSKYIDEKYLKQYTYLKIYVNNMNLVTSISITADEYGDTLFGPFTYDYYHDKNFNIDDLYEYIDSCDKNNVITVTFKNIENDKTMSTVVLCYGENLIIETGKKYNIYLDKEGTINYDTYQDKLKMGDEVDNIFTKDINLFVEERYGR